LAGVTTAQGSFTIELDDFNGRCIPCRIPLSDPAKGDLAGRLIIHSMDVGPGPLSSELTVFLARQAPTKFRPESVVSFQMLNGRIYHQGLELMFPDISIRTSGSVGLKDETLDIAAEMPVPPKWLVGNTAISQAMQNQVIRVPIAGTLAKPRVDMKVVENYSRQFLQRAATNVIESEVGKQLDRLFGPKK
jgi:translocation and assembly module TamB